RASRSRRRCGCCATSARRSPPRSTETSPYDPLTPVLASDQVVVMTTADSDATVAPAARPILRVVRGEPTAEEIAALLAVVTARVEAEPEPEPRRSLWARPI